MSHLNTYFFKKIGYVDYESTVIQPSFMLMHVGKSEANRVLVKIKQGDESLVNDIEELVDRLGKEKIAYGMLSNGKELLLELIFYLPRLFLSIHL